MHSEQHNQSTKFIYTSDQGRNTSENSMEPEEQEAVPVQEYDTHKAPIQQPTPDQQPSVQLSVPDEHTEDSQLRQRIRSNLGQRLKTYAQEYVLVATITGEIMAINTRIYQRTRIYVKAEVSYPDTIYFHREGKENDATQFLKAVQK